MTPEAKALRKALLARRPTDMYVLLPDPRDRWDCLEPAEQALLLRLVGAGDAGIPERGSAPEVIAAFAWLGSLGLAFLWRPRDREGLVMRASASGITAGEGR